MAGRPAENFAEAFARFETLRALDDERIIPQAYSRFWSQLERVQLSVVLIHGLTNCPEQWSLFASQLHARGHNVIVPRLPGHGDRDRRGKRLARVAAEAWFDTANEAFDIACGAGRRVVVAGLSLGGVIAGALAQRRSELARALCIAPLFGLAHVPPSFDAPVESALLVLPNLFVPWDPFGDQSQIPAHAYPQFPTRALGETLRIGREVAQSARRAEPAAGQTVMVLNAHEPATNNGLALAVVQDWQRRRPGSAATFEFSNLPVNHDIIDPSNPLARTAIVYPKLTELIEA